MNAPLAGPAAPLAVALAVALALAPLSAAAAPAPATPAARELPLDAPLGVGTESPLRHLFLDMTGADARPPPGPRGSVRWQASNSWSTRTTLVRGSTGAVLQLDAQEDALIFAASAPWTSLWPRGGDAPVVGPVVRRLTTSLEARASVWWGGWTDGPVESWHRLIRSTNFDRGMSERGRVGLIMSDANETAFDVRQSRTSFGGVVIRNQLLLAEGGSSLRAPPAGARSRWAVSLRLDVKLPIGSPERLGSSGRTDVGAGILGTAELARWCVLHANLTTSAWQPVSDRASLKPLRLHHGAEVSGVFLWRSWALILEDRLLSPIFAGDWRRVGEPGHNPLAASATFAAIRWQNQLSVGLRRGRFTAWFSEDFTPGSDWDDDWFYNSNAPDFTFGIEVAHGL